MHGTVTDSNSCQSNRTDKKTGHGHELYMASFFSSLDLFDDFTKKKLTAVELSG